MNKIKLITMLIVGTMVIASSTAIAEEDFEIPDDENTFSRMSNLFDNLKLGKISSMFDLLNMSLSSYNMNREILFGNTSNIMQLNMLKNLNLFNDIDTGIEKLDLEDFETFMQQYNKEAFIINSIKEKMIEQLQESKPKQDMPDGDEETEGGGQSLPREVIIKFKDDYEFKDLSKNIEYLQDSIMPNVLSSTFSTSISFDELKVEELFKDEGICKVELPEYIDPSSFISECKKDLDFFDAVEYIELNYCYQIYKTNDGDDDDDYSYGNYPNDPDFDEQWSLHQTSDHDIDAPEAWNVETGSSDVVIAVIDTGVRDYHDDLEDNIWINPGEIENDGIDNDGNGYIDDVIGWDFVDNDRYPGDSSYSSHGTMCASIIGAVGNNNKLMAGICWNCSIMPVRCFYDGMGYADKIAEGIIYAVDNGADIISMSWGANIDSQLIRDAIEYAYSEGVVLIAASGNSNNNLKMYPAAYSEVIAVAATDENDEKAGFSNWGSWIDVAAPGVDIPSIKYSRYDTYDFTGTSAACPHVAGLAGLILSHDDSLTPEMVKTIIKSGVENISFGGSSRFPYIGIGRINANNSLHLISDMIANLDDNLDDTIVSGEIDISGTAAGTDFDSYSLYYGQGTYPDIWNLITSSTSAVEDDILGTLDTTVLQEGTYTIKLSVIDSSGQFYNDTAVITIHNVINTWHVGGVGSDNLTSIQEAVCSTGDGDSVIVYPGNYSENIVVDRSITINGENKETTVIDPEYCYHTFYVTADHVSISNITIERSHGEGILCTGADYVNVNNNIIKIDTGVLLLDSKFASVSNNTFCDRNRYGVLALPFTMEFMLDIYEYELRIIEMIDSIGHYPCEATIRDNEFLSESIGIFMIMTDDNIIENNVFSLINEGNSSYSLGDSSILLISSSENTVIDNIMTGGGLFIFDSDENTVEDNSVNEKPLVYLEGESNQTIDDAGQVILIDCTYITVEDIDFSKVIVGIQLFGTDNCDIQSNTISKAHSGIFMISSKNNEISNNRINDTLSAVSSLSGGNTFEENTIFECGFGIAILGIESYTFSKLSDTEFHLIVTGDQNNNIIRSNDLTNVGFGITILSNGKNTIEGNTVKYTKQHGYHHRPVYGGFAITSVALKSIDLSCSLEGDLEVTITGGQKDCIIKNNDITNYTYGIITFSDKDVIIEGNNINRAYLTGILSISFESMYMNMDVPVPPGYEQQYAVIEGEVVLGHHTGMFRNNSINATAVGIAILSDSNNFVEYNTLDNIYVHGILDVSIQSAILFEEIMPESGIIETTVIGGKQDQKIINNEIFGGDENYYGIVGISVISDSKHTISDNNLNEVLCGIASVSFDSASINADMRSRHENVTTIINGGGDGNIIQNNIIHNTSVIGIGIISDTPNTITQNIIQSKDISYHCGIATASIDSVVVDIDYISTRYENDDENIQEVYNNYTGLVTITGGEQDSAIENNEIKDTYVGIIICSDARNTITGNTLENSFELGILSASIDNIVTEQIANGYYFDNDTLYISEQYDSIKTSIDCGEKENLVDNNKLNNSFLGIMVLSNAENNILENQLSNIRAIGIASSSMETAQINIEYFSRHIYENGSSSRINEYNESIKVNGGQANCLIKDNELENIGVLLTNISSGIIVSSNANTVVERNSIQNLTLCNNSFGRQSNGVLLLPANIELKQNEFNSSITDIVILPDSSTDKNIVRYNVINGDGKGHGITLWNSEDNLIYENTIENNVIGIYIPEEPFNEFSDSYTQFIAEFNSDDNQIYHNSFINNVQQAYDECDNTWDDGYPSGGNYWDDYTGVDEDPEDGIGDTPYDIPGGINQDRYPLMEIYGENRQPIAVDDYVTTDENTAITIDVLDNDHDLDGDVVLLHSYDATSTKGGSITVDDNETTTTSDDKLVYMPPLDYDSPPSDTFEYEISDGNGKTDTATVHIIINNVNDVPIPSKPTGETNGDTGIDYEFTFNATDPDGDLVSYFIDWGDGNNSGWIGPYPEGTEITRTYNWTEYGTYDVKVKARDDLSESGWAEALTVKILEDVPEVKLTIKSGFSFKKVTAELENTGNIAVSDVDLSLTVEYGFLKIKSDENNMTIEAFEPGDSETIIVDGISGLKTITITATAESPDFDTITKEAKGFVLFGLVIVSSS